MGAMDDNTKNANLCPKLVEKCPKKEMHTEPGKIG